jgi:tetratricopeptide (TPR) repeat protein
MIHSLESKTNNLPQIIKSNLPIILIIIVAAGIRLAYWFQFQASPFGPILMVDAEGYHLKALKLLTEGWVGNSAFYQAPLYPYFLAIIYKVFGSSTATVQAIQIVLSAATVWLVYKIGENLFSHKVALLSSGLCAFYGPFIFYSILILKVTLSLFFSCLFILTLLWACDSFKKKLFFFGGILLGINIALRGNFLLLYPATALWILFYFPNIKTAKKLINLLVFTLGMALCVLPMTLRNNLLSNDLVITSYQAGANFYIGNNPVAKGNYTTLGFVRANPLFEETDFRKRAETLEGRPLKPSEVSRFWFKKTFQFIIRYPTHFLRLLRTKSSFFFNNYEIPDNYDYQFVKTLVPSLNIGAVSFGFILLLSTLGIAVFRWVGSKFLLIYIFLITYTASVVLFFVTSRYRIPIAPILLPLSAFFILEGVQKIRNSSRKEIPFVATVFLVMAFIAFKPISLVDFSFSYKGIGLAYEKKGLLQDALQQYQNAENIKPGNAKAIYHIGAIYFKLNNIQRAEETLIKSIELNPKFAESHFALAEIYAKNGLRQKAILSYRSGLKVNPADYNSHFNLGELYRLNGNIKEAIKENTIALRLKPDFADAHFNIGGLYILSNNYKAAKLHYERAKKLGFKIPKVNRDKLNDLITSNASSH